MSKELGRWEWWVRGVGLAVIGGVFAALFLGIGELRFSSYQWLPSDNPTQANKRYLDTEFNRGEGLVAVVELGGQEFFEGGLLDELDAVVEAMREIDEVSNVNSPLHATTVIRDAENTLHIFPFREALEQGLLDLQGYARKLAGSHYQGRLIDDAGERFVIQLTLDLDFDANNTPIRAAVIAQAGEILRGSRHFREFGFSGETELHHRIDTLSQENAVKLLPLAAVGLVILLVVFLRSLRYVVITCVVTAMTLLLAFNVNRVLGIPFNVLSASLPVLILTIAVADSIHIIKRWQDLLGEEASAEAAVRKPWGIIVKCWQQTWRPCFFTSLTSASGFGVFYFSELIPLRDFGLVAFISVLLAWVTIMFTTLALLYILRPSGRRSLDWRWFALVPGEFLRRRSREIVWGGGVIFVVFLLSLPFVKTETNFLEVFFHPESKTRQTFDLVDGSLSGSGRVDVIVRGGAGEAFKRMERFEMIQEQVGELGVTGRGKVRAVSSLLEPVQMVHGPLGGEGEYPSSEEALAQELLFLEFSRDDVSADVLSEFVDFDYRNSRISLYTNNMKSSASAELLADITPTLERMRPLEYLVTGANIYAHRLSDYVLEAQARSIMLTLLVVWLVFLVQFGWRLGSVAVCGSFAPVMCIITLQILARVPFDFSTVMVASVSMGLAIDATIHFLHRFNFHRGGGGGGGGVGSPMERAIGDTRQPIFTTTLILVAGFSLLTQSELQVVDRFSILLGIALFLSIPATFVLLPGLLNRFIVKGG